MSPNSLLATCKKLLAFEDSGLENDLSMSTEVEKGAEEDQDETDESQYPPMKVVIPTMMSIYAAVFLTALDRTIIGVAIPSISNEFHSFGDISWYEAAFLLTFCTFQLPMGKIYKFFSVKWTFITIIAIFEIGSIVCASAPSSNAFIVGRAIAGMGGAGTTAGAMIIMVDLVPLRKRPKYQGFLGAVFGVSSILGPLIGGAFTTNVSWRWCFWINVPIGGATLVGLVFLLPRSPPIGDFKGTPLEKVKMLDPIGNLFLLPGLVCVILALEWGGTLYPWNDGHVIAVIVVGAVLLFAFVLVQVWVQDNGTVPPRILCQRSIAAGVVVSLGVGGVLIISAFYLPIWFQAIKGVPAVDAGIRLLAYFLGTVVAVISCGILISKIGYYTPWLIGGSSVLVLGTALLTTFRVNTSTGEWIGYPIIVGAGMGMSLQQSNMAAQTVLPRKDIPAGITLIAFANFFGGAVFLSVCQTVLANTLLSELAIQLPSFDASKILSTGATDIKDLVPKDKLSVVLGAYNKAIDNVFYCSLGLSCLALVASLFMEWKTVKKQQPVA